MEDSRVRILDPVSRAQLPNVYRSATVCVVPSLWEGFGYAAAEAMACGATVVASRIGGLAEIVKDDRFGVLVEPGNAEELAQTVLSLIQDSERCSQIGIQARERIVSEFSRPAITARMAKLYHEVVASRKA
jgi:glycosyltransferase involved in cell wall biosynthesis